MSRSVVGVRVIALAAACAGFTALSCGPAAASDTIIGGHAELCSQQAKLGLFTPEAIENCTLAIGTESLLGHLLAATYVNRGTMFISAANYASAMRDFDNALSVEPNLAVAFVNRGGALVGLRRYKEAEAEIDKGLALNPEEPEKAYGNRALARWSQDNLKGAYEDFQKALELKPDWEWPREQLTHFTLGTPTQTAGSGPVQDTGPPSARP